MTDIVKALHGIVLMSVSVLCVTVSLTVITVGKHLSRTMMDADSTITRVNTTLDKINGKSGTLQEVNESIVRVKDLMTLSQATLQRQQKSIDTWDSQIGNTLANANRVLESLKSAGDTTSASEVQIAVATTEAIQGAQPVLSNATAELQDLQTATNNLNALIVSSNNTVKSLDATATDVQDEVHKLTHPAKKKLGFWGTVWAAAQIVHKLSPPLF